MPFTWYQFVKRCHDKTHIRTFFFLPLCARRTFAPLNSLLYHVYGMHIFHLFVETCKAAQCNATSDSRIEQWLWQSLMGEKFEKLVLTIIYFFILYFLQSQFIWLQMATTTKKVRRTKHGKLQVQRHTY